MCVLLQSVAFPFPLRSTVVISWRKCLTVRSIWPLRIVSQSEMLSRIRATVLGGRNLGDPALAEATLVPHRALASPLADTVFHCLQRRTPSSRVPCFLGRRLFGVSWASSLFLRYARGNISAVKCPLEKTDKQKSAPKSKNISETKTGG